MQMSPELATAVADAGAEVVATVAAYLREPSGDAWSTAIRRTLADVLDQGEAADGPDPALVAVVTSWAASTPDRLLSPVSAWLRVATCPSVEPAGPAGLVSRAAAREVDEALGVALRTADA